MKMVGVLSIAAILLIGVVSENTVAGGAVTKAQVKAKLLSLGDMPTGWSVDNSSSGGVTTSNCLHVLKTSTKSVVRTSVSYVNSHTPAMQEVLEAGRGASARYKEFNKELSGCKKISFTSQGQTISGTVGAMSFPKVGSQSNAFAIKLNVQGVSLGADYVIFKDGQYAGAIGYEDIGQPDATQLQAFVTEAIDKIEGKPTTPPTTF
jgi:hypothetical protein